MRLWLRHARARDDVVVRADLAAIEGGKHWMDGIEELAHAFDAMREIGTDYRGALVERQGPDVAKKARPRVAAKQVLLDVRRVERADAQAPASQIIANARERFVAGEIADDRDDQIARFVRFQRREVRFGPEKPVIASIGRRL